MNRVAAPEQRISVALLSVMRHYGDDRSTFGGSYKEDLDRFLYTYDNVSLACGVMELEKRGAMVLMLRDKTAHFSIVLATTAVHTRKISSS